MSTKAERASRALTNRLLEMLESRGIPTHGFESARGDPVPRGKVVAAVVYFPSSDADLWREAQQVSCAKADPVAFREYIAGIRAEIDEILADEALPPLEEVSARAQIEHVCGLVEPDSELLAHGFLWGIPLHE
jgi:hypothetical protein